MSYRVVLDTSVLISGLYSRRGASFQLLSMLGGKEFEISVSVPLVLEYEGVAKAKARELGLSHGDVDDVIDYLCSVADRRLTAEDGEALKSAAPRAAPAF